MVAELVLCVNMKKFIKKFINRETISYLVAGICTTVVSLVVFAVAINAGIGTALSNTIAHVLATLFAYLVNKVFVFQSGSWKLGFLAKEFGKFVGARVFTYAGETLLLVFLVDIIGFNAMLMKMFTTGIVVLGNYLLSKMVVFKK